MPGWPKNLAGMLPGQSCFIFCCITVTVQTVVQSLLQQCVEQQKVHLYSRAALRLQRWQPVAGAGADPHLVLVHISWLGWRQLLKTARASAVLCCAYMPWPLDHALRLPTSRSCLQSVHLFAPTALMRVAPSAAQMIPMLQCLQRPLPVEVEAQTAPGNLLQG